MIELKNVSLAFDDLVIFNQVNLSIESSEQIAIIGESGCGKSTLLRLILGFITPDKGSIMFMGKDIYTMSKIERRLMRMEVGMLFQSSALFDSMTVGENVAFSLCENKGLTYEEAEPQIFELLNMVEMSGSEDQMPSSLSGGQKKRIGLARTIALEPKVIMYDEPTTGLDPILSTSIEDLIVKLGADMGITTILVSHQKSTILRTVDKIYMMKDGCLIDSGTPSTIEDSDNEYIKYFINGGLK